MIAIGLGCRRGCAAEEITDLVHRASRLAGISLDAARLFTIAEKHSEAGLIEAAVKLGLPLGFLPAAALKEGELLLNTRSERVMALFGTPSVAEAAALAGAGPGARLLAGRLASASATCAIGTVEKTP